MSKQKRNVIQEVFLKIKEKIEMTNENLTATAKESKYTALYIVVRDNISQKEVGTYPILAIKNIK